MRKLSSGLWAIVAEFGGPWHAWRVEEFHTCDLKDTCVIPITETGADRSWDRPHLGQWVSSLGQSGYIEGVERVRAAIGAGEVDQLNLCRVLSAPVAQPPDARSLHASIARGNPAPYSGWFDFTTAGTDRRWIVSASPELALCVDEGRLVAAPIKGTAPTAEELLDKDYLESAFVTNRLADSLRHLTTGTPEVDFFDVQAHPGLVQLVSTITMDLKLGPEGEPDWGEILRAALPPLSVAGIPRKPAMDLIHSLEPVSRGPYCGAIGWIDADRNSCELAATIRSFWWEEGALKFGTGAGITQDSDPHGEWEETELKSKILLGLVSDGGGEAR